MEYTSKQKVIENGFTKKNGIIYKKSLLEIWYAKSWLELPNSKFTAEDRCPRSFLYCRYYMQNSHKSRPYILIIQRHLVRSTKRANDRLKTKPIIALTSASAYPFGMILETTGTPIAITRVNRTWQR